MQNNGKLGVCDILKETIRPDFCHFLCVFSKFDFECIASLFPVGRLPFLCSLVEEAVPRGVVDRSGAASCGVLGRTGVLCVAAAVKVRDAPQCRQCWAVGATGWVTNNLNSLLAGVHRDLACNALPLLFWVSATSASSIAHSAHVSRRQLTRSFLTPCVRPPPGPMHPAIRAGIHDPASGTGVKKSRAIDID